MPVPMTDGAAGSGAGVGKPPREERRWGDVKLRGRCYGDLAAADDAPERGRGDGVGCVSAMRRVSNRQPASNGDEYPVLVAAICCFYESRKAWSRSQDRTMRRRDFITLLLGGAATCPRAVRAQQGVRMRRIAVLASVLPPDDAEWQARGTAFVQALQERGWTDGRNVRIEYRWGLGDSERVRNYAAELVAL